MHDPAAGARIGPDALEFGGLLVEAAERSTRDGLAREEPDEHAAARRGEFLRRVAPQPPAHPLDGPAVSGGVLDGEFGKQWFGQRIVLADRDEAQLTTWEWTSPNSPTRTGRPHSRLPVPLGVIANDPRSVGHRRFWNQT